MPHRINVTMRQLRAFSEVYRLRNLTRAADSLHMTQSAVSALIRQLEDALRVSLFDRTPRMLKPTRAGESAYAKVEEILGQVVALQDGMAELGERGDAVLAFSCVPALASAVVPQVLSAFRKAMPDVRPVMFDEGDATIIERVMREECEFSIGSFAHTRGGVAQLPIVVDHVNVVCARNSPLLQLPRVTWADLVDPPIINLSRGVSLRHLISDYLPGTDSRWKPAYEVGFIHTALAMVAQGLGVLILPGFYVKGNPHAADVCALKLHEPAVEHALLIHTREGHALSQPARTFLDLLAQRLREFP